MGAGKKVDKACLAFQTDHMCMKVKAEHVNRWLAAGTVGLQFGPICCLLVQTPTRLNQPKATYKHYMNKKQHLLSFALMQR